MHLPLSTSGHIPCFVVAWLLGAIIPTLIPCSLLICLSLHLVTF